MGTLRAWSTTVRRPDPSAPTDPTNESTEDRTHRRREPLAGAYRWLLLFMVVYCARPEDWIPGLAALHLAKVAGILAFIAFLLSIEQVRGGLLGLPKEMFYMVLLLVQLGVSAFLSPVWRGGAVQRATDFAKPVLITLVIAMVVNSIPRLRRLLFVETASVAMVVLATLIKGRASGGRLTGILNGMYQNPNDFAFAIALALPFALAFLLQTRGVIRKFFWVSVMVIMAYAVVLTASRSGLLALVMAAGVSLWEFGIKGRRHYLLVGAAVVLAAVLIFAGGLLKARFQGTFDVQDNTLSSYGSAEQRRALLKRSIVVTAEHPLFGVGVGNFQIVSGVWRVTHNAYTEMSSEGGIPAFILFLLILWRGFANVRGAKRQAQDDTEVMLFAGALEASLAGFIVGAFFESVAYLFFPYIMVACTTAMLSIVLARQSADLEPASANGLTRGRHPGAVRASAWRW